MDLNQCLQFLKLPSFGNFVMWWHQVDNRVNTCGNGDQIKNSSKSRFLDFFG